MQFDSTVTSVLNTTQLLTLENVVKRFERDPDASSDEVIPMAIATLQQLPIPKPHRKDVAVGMLNYLAQLDTNPIPERKDYDRRVQLNFDLAKGLVNAETSGLCGCLSSSCSWGPQGGSVSVRQDPNPPPAQRMVSRPNRPSQ
jgi:hypothetical protein